MRDLVAEMPEQSAIGLAHGLALAFALGIVGLRHIEGNEPAGVPGHDPRMRRRGSDRIREEIKRETIGILQPGCQRQTKAQQRIEQPVLGEFDLSPMPKILGTHEIGDGAVVATGGAEYFRLVAVHQPVADVVLGVGAKLISLSRRRQRAQQSVRFFQCGDERPFRQIAEPKPAAFARGVLEIERLSAVLALEKLHGPRPSRPLRCGDMFG